MREAVARASRLSGVREFDLLARIGLDDLPGALRVIPSDEHGERIAPEAPPDVEDSEASSALLKFSLAGLQVKFSVSRTDRALTLPVSGVAGNAILKLPDSRLGFDLVPVAEYAAMTLSAAVGIRTPEVSLVNAALVAGLDKWADHRGEMSLLVERFDRNSGGGRVHVEELAQVLDVPAGGQDAKYRRANFETVANVVGALSGTEAVGDVIDRIVLNILIGNGDAHLKNWAVTYPDGIHPELSPAYDLVPTVLYIPKDNLGLNLNGSKVFEEVSVESFGRLGERSGYGRSRAVSRAREAVERVLARWSVFEGLLAAEHASRLTARLRTLRLVQELN